MSTIIQRIEAVVPSLLGWSTPEKGIVLAGYIMGFQPKTIVEIGVFGGRSAIPMMMACQEVRYGAVNCIDPWSANESVKGQTEADKKWWAEVPDHERIYESFKDAVSRFQLGSHCILQRCTSDEAVVPDQIDFLHLDGNHGPQAVHDAKRFVPKIPLHGICVLDDLDWSGGSVREAEKYILSQGFTELHNLGTGALYMKMK